MIKYPQTRKLKLSPFPSDPSCLPDMDKQMTVLYGVLSEDNKRIFVKIYRYLWRSVFPVSRFIGFGGVLYSYWVVDLLRNKYKIKLPSLVLLTYISHLTDKGRKYVHINAVLNGFALSYDKYSTRYTAFKHILRNGFILRSKYNPDNPHYLGCRTGQPVFISLSSSGASLINAIEHDIHLFLMQTSLDELRGVQIKKP
jgi:hypothetical protein